MFKTLLKLLWFLNPVISLWMAEADDPPPPADPPKTTDPEAGFNALLERHRKDTRAAAYLLYQENYQYRGEVRELQKDLERVRKQVPAEGAIVLSKEEAESWQKYQALGKPEEIEAERTENKRMKREKLLGEAAEAHKLKPNVLQQLAGDLPIEIKEIEDNGQKKKVAFVKGADGQEKSLTDYAKANWADFMPSLETQPQQQTTTYTRQSVGGPGPKTNVVQDTLSKRYAKRDKEVVSS